VIRELFDDEDSMIKISEDAIKWWEKKCSEKAVGGYMAEKINSISVQNSKTANYQF